jgi:hypothetical protein
MAKSGSQIDGLENSRIFRRVLGTSIRGIWIHLPTALRFSSPGQAYGRFVHALVLRYARREPAFPTARVPRLIILWTIRSARPDLRLTISAVDMSREVLEFAERGVYSRRSDVTGDTFKDQKKSIFERLTDEEMEAMFEVEDDLVKVRPRLKDGTIWRNSSVFWAIRTSWWQTGFSAT